MQVHITRTSEFPKTFKTESLRSKFDLSMEKITEHFDLEVDIPDQWNIGVIYGASGTGKTTLTGELFGKYLQTFAYSNEPIIESISNARVDEITDVFNKVGFSSPPSWLKPYHVLSNGEKMRVDLARAILSDIDIIVFDEFTSVIDRNVAKIASFAIQKYCRKHGKKFVAVSCHEDVIEWLQPDWLIDTNQMAFFRAGTESPDKDLRSPLQYIERTKPFGDCLRSITI